MAHFAALRKTEEIMLLNLIITGVGGQGNVLASQILGRAAVKKGLQVTIGETFGLSQRGGPVMSHVRVSDERLLSPIIPPNRADVVVGLEPLETVRILSEFGNDGCTFIVNSRPIYPLNVIAGDVAYPDPDWMHATIEACARRLYWLEGTQQAIELGGPIMLNMVMLGALCALEDMPIVQRDVEAVIGELFPASKLEPNRQALQTGREMVLSYEN